MKKLLTIGLTALTVTTANATPSIKGNIASTSTLPVAGYVVPKGQVVRHIYNDGYDHGYKAGKNKQRANTVKALVITGGLVVLGLSIYELGKNSRWTANEDGVVYRF